MTASGAHRYLGRRYLSLIHSPTFIDPPTQASEWGSVFTRSLFRTPINILRPTALAVRRAGGDGWGFLDVLSLYRSLITRFFKKASNNYPSRQYCDEGRMFQWIVINIIGMPSSLPQQSPSMNIIQS
ncbi:hypothetical protein PM082_004581 [Marasmius tenuissimus]|nr:hypothetical protein PM082_004581 [Marasmius tenuissimus]